MSNLTSKRSEPEIARRRLSKLPESSRTRSDTGEAFLPDPSESGARVLEEDVIVEMGEEMGEEYVRAATSGGTAYADDPDATPEEMGDPFSGGEPSEDDEEDDDEPDTLRRV